MRLYLGNGASWSLFFCHSIVTKGMLWAVGRMGLSDSEARDRLVVDGRPIGKPEKSKPLLAPYVDNGNAICYDREDAEIFSGFFCRYLQKHGIRFHVECVAAGAWNAVGLTLRLNLRWIHNKSARMWHLRAATIEFRAQGRASGDAVRAFLGLAVHALLVERCFLCIFSHLFRYAQLGSVVTQFDEFVDGELRCFAGILPFLGTKLDRDYCPTVVCSDASLRGFAVHTRDVDVGMVADMCKVRERWKYKAAKGGVGAEPRPVEVPEQSADFAGE